MGRPRKSGHHLPTDIYWKHGAYYTVVQNKWVRLGETQDEVNARLPYVPLWLAPATDDALRVLLAKLSATKRGAAKRGLSFSLTRADVAVLLKKSGGRCAVTGIDFTAEVVNGSRPHSPSIDRIDSSAGYSLGNCRIVCLAANLAMNVWGEQILNTFRGPLETRKSVAVSD